LPRRRTDSQTFDPLRGGFDLGLPFFSSEPWPGRWFDNELTRWSDGGMTTYLLREGYNAPSTSERINAGFRGYSGINGFALLIVG